MSDTLVIGEKSLRYAHIPSARENKAPKSSSAGATQTLPGVFFCGGFRSDMGGTKAMYLQHFCESNGLQYTRFDYRGHGSSSGEFTECGIDDWRLDTLDILDHICKGPQIIVGSSMGLWMAMLACIARPARINSLVGIAGAPDFTERLIWQGLDAGMQAKLTSGEIWYRPSTYDDGSPYPIGMGLIESGRPWLLLDHNPEQIHKAVAQESTPAASSISPSPTIPVNCPVRLLHGTADDDVPWQLSQELLLSLTSNDASLTLVKNADHRLSSAENLSLLENILVNLIDL